MQHLDWNVLSVWELAKAFAKIDAFAICNCNTSGQEATQSRWQDRTCVQDASGHVVETCTTSVLEEAKGQPITAEQLRKALGSTLGPDTAFRLRELSFEGTRLFSLLCLLAILLSVAPLVVPVVLFISREASYA